MKEIRINDKTLSIRPAEESDAEILADLGAYTFSHTYSSILPSKDLEDYLGKAFSVEQMRQDIADPQVLLFVSSVSNTVCSYIKLQPTPPREVIRGNKPIELLRLYLLPQWEGMGIGSALMKAGLRAAREESYETCWLKVWEGNRRAIEFYENRGFTQVGSEPYPVGSTSRKVILMACPLK